MCRGTEGYCHTGIRMSVAFIICSSILSGGLARGAASYRLSKEGYSPTAKSLLLAITDDPNDPLKHSWLATYEEASGLVNRVALPLPRYSVPADFAWVPGRAAFVVTHIQGMTLFQIDDSGHSYTPRAIRCPTDAFYRYCSWNPAGEWLAVNCLDRDNVVRGRLGLFRFGDRKLVKTALGIDYRQVVWGNDGLLYATDDDKVLAVEVKAGEPSAVCTSALNTELTAFYGMFGEQPLFQSYDEVKLGDKTLIALDQPAGLRVVATEVVAFVSASPGQLVAFDRLGREIDKSAPGRIVKLGSVKDPNTVYGIAGSMLLRVSVVNGHLRTQEVCDLTKKLQQGMAD